MFAEGSLKIEFEKEIEIEMRNKLTWNAAKISLETEFNQSKFSNDEERRKKKTVAITENKIKKRLTKNSKPLRQSTQFLKSKFNLRSIVLR